MEKVIPKTDKNDSGQSPAKKVTKKAAKVQSTSFDYNSLGIASEPKDLPAALRDIRTRTPVGGSRVREPASNVMAVGENRDLTQIAEENFEPDEMDAKSNNEPDDWLTTQDVTTNPEGSGVDIMLQELGLPFDVGLAPKADTPVQFISPYLGSLTIYYAEVLSLPDGLIVLVKDKRDQGNKYTPPVISQDSEIPFQLQVKDDPPVDVVIPGIQFNFGCFNIMLCVRTQK